MLISNDAGEAVAYALWNLEDRGPMMIEPGWKVYQGMIVGEHNRDNDLEVNVLKGKKLTNIRTTSKDEAVRLTPPIRMTLERALAWIQDDELVEVTPKSIRLRKAILGEGGRDGDDALALASRAAAPTSSAAATVGAGRDAARNALELRHEARGVEGGLVADRHHLVDDRAVEHLGHEAGADALDLVRARLAAGEDRRVLRLHRDDLQPGRRGLSTWPTPVMVPPVPTPATKASISPLVSFQISSAVVRRWISGLAGFLNCCGMTAPGSPRGAPRPWRPRPSCPAAGREHELGAQEGQHLAALDRHGLRHDQDQPVAARPRATKASAMPVLPEVGSIESSPGLDPRRRAPCASIMLTPMRSLTLAIGLKNSSLTRISASTPALLRQAVEAHERGVADRLGDGIVDPAPAGLADRGRRPRACEAGRP